MKRRVLRAHANKRCLRILSASNQLRTPSTSDRGYGVLCDASFLRAVLLAYWQAHAPAAWREARKRQLRKAANAAAAAATAVGPDGQATQPTKTQSKQQKQQHSLEQEEKDAASPSAKDNQSGQDPQLPPNEATSSSEREQVTKESNASNRKSQSAKMSKSHSAPPPSSGASPSVSVAANIARLPVQLPSTSPLDFLNALMQEAFHTTSSNNSSDGRIDDSDGFTSSPAQRKRAQGSNTANQTNKSIPFLFHCLPETLTALHRMREATSAPVADAAEASRQQESAVRGGPAAARSKGQSHLTETERWLAASFGDLATPSAHQDDAHARGASSPHGRSGPHHHHPHPPPPHQQQQHHGGFSGSATPALTFQEIPAVVVHALLSRLSLLQDPQQMFSVAAADASSIKKQTKNKEGNQRNESKAIADFMSFNQFCLTHGTDPNSLSPQDSFGYAHVRLCVMPRFTDFSGVLGHHALKRLRRNQRARGEQIEVPQQQQQQQGKDSEKAPSTSNSSAPVPARPFLPRSFFVATQSHDVRRRLAPAAALLRLTTNPDAIWIEQRGTAYHYDMTEEDGKHHFDRNNSDARGASTNHRGDAAARSAGFHGHGTNSRDELEAGGGGRRRRSGEGAPHGDPRTSLKRSRTSSLFSSSTTAPASAASATPTVVAAAPQLSRADVAFMKHLGTASNLSLPDKTSHMAALKTATTPTTAEKGKDNGSSNRAAESGRKRSRQKGQNPLSMKKKQKREVFRA